MLWLVITVGLLILLLMGLIILGRKEGRRMDQHLEELRKNWKDAATEKGRTIDLQEFVDTGYLQELNRQFLHPLGLALEVTIEISTGKVTQLSSIWDCRDDPEGIIFGQDTVHSKEYAEKAQRIADLQASRTIARRERLGFLIQPVETE